MAGADYCCKANTGADAENSSERLRADALGCHVLCIGDSTGRVRVWPSVVVLSTVRSAITVIPDDQGQATQEQVFAALDAAIAAEDAAEIASAASLAALAKAMGIPPTAG